MLNERVPEADRVVRPRVRYSPRRYDKFRHGPKYDGMEF